MAAVTAEETVVLPIPISPVAIRLVFCSATSSVANSMPASKQRTACWRDMAGPKLMSSVPRAIRRERSLAVEGKASAAIPASTTI